MMILHPNPIETIHSVKRLGVMFFLGFFLASLMTGCSSIPVSSLYKLREMNVLKTNPEFISIAIRTHQAFGIEPGDVTLKMGYSAEDLKINETYPVTPTYTKISNSRIAQTGNNQHIIQLMLTVEEAARMRDAQRRIREHKKQGGEGNGYFSVSITGICRYSKAPSGPLMADTFIKTENASEFVPLVQDFDLRGEHQGWDNNIANWPRCK